MLNWALNSRICSEFPAWRWLRVTWCGCWELPVTNAAAGRGTWGDSALNASCTSTSARFTRLPHITNASLGLTFVINHPSQFSIWVALLLVQWYTAAVTGRRSWQFARFKGKKPNFKCIWDFSFIPLEGWLKVIFSSSFGLGFALSRARETQTFTVSTLTPLIMAEKEQGTY